MKRLLVLLLLMFGGSSLAQIDYPVDIVVGQRWVGTDEAAFYGGARTYLPLGAELFGSQIFLIPELGIDRDTLDPYARAELNVGTNYGTAAAFVTYMDGTPRINLEFRTCVLSDRCGD